MLIIFVSESAKIMYALKFTFLPFLKPAIQLTDSDDYTFMFTSKPAPGAVKGEKTISFKICLVVENISAAIG